MLDEIPVIAVESDMSNCDGCIFNGPDCFASDSQMDYCLDEYYKDHMIIYKHVISK